MADKPKKTILVVEDVEEIGSRMDTMLSGKGHRVLRASTADEAIRIAEDDHPTMILTDLDLPTFDLLVRLIRDHQRLNSMVIAVIDINGPEVNAKSDLKILGDFKQLDELLASIRPPIEC